jgi:hypothetical protein
LLGHERDNLGWNRLEVVRDKAEIPEDTQLKGIGKSNKKVAVYPGPEHL